MDRENIRLVVSFKGIPFRFIPNTRTRSAATEHRQAIGGAESMVQRDSGGGLPRLPSARTRGSDPQISGYLSF